MKNRAVAWSSLVIAVLAPVTYVNVFRHGWKLIAQDSDHSDQIVQLIWLTFIVSEVVAVILSIVACSGQRNSPKAALPLPAIIGAVLALLGLAFFGLLFRPGA